MRIVCVSSCVQAQNRNGNLTCTFHRITMKLLLQLTDSDRLVQESLDEMKQECKYAVLADTSTIANNLNMNPDDLVTLVMTLTCLNDCSGHGQCNNGKKQMENRFYIFLLYHNFSHNEKEIQEIFKFTGLSHCKSSYL